MNRVFMCLLATALAAALHTPAQAVVLFADDFENTTGPLPALPDMPQAGEWFRFSLQSPESHVIDTPADDIAPGAHSGSNYLWIDRPTLNEFGNAGISDGATTPGTVVHAEWWVNVTEGYAGFGFNTTPGANVLDTRPFVYAVPGGEIGRYVPASVNPNEYLPTGLSWTQGVWQKYELDTTIGSSSVMLTVDGNAVNIDGPFGISPAPTIDAVYGMLFAAASSTVSYYVDDVLVEVEVPESADFDADDDVDGADLLVWQRGVGVIDATPSDGDANGDMSVDAADLEVWRGQFGQTPGVVSVPEPCSLVGVLILASSAVALRRSRK